MDERKRSTKKPTRHGKKLKNEQTSREAMRKKLRYGKKDNSLTLEEKKELKKLRTQGRTKAYVEQAASVQFHHALANSNQDDNVATDAVNRSMEATEIAVEKVQKAQYSRKLHERTKAKSEQVENAKKGSNELSRVYQKNRMKKEIVEQAERKQAKEAANSVGSVGRKFVDKAEDLMGKFAEFVAEHLAENPMAVIVILALGIVLLVVMTSFSSCSMMATGVQNVTVASSFTAEDDQILTVDQDYTNLETALQNTLNNIERDHPGYDEYRYELDNIGHNPFQVAALLTVLYENYTQSQVQGMLQTLFNGQYTLTIQEIVEVRTRTETRTGTTTVDNGDGTTSEEEYEYEVEVEYNYYILKTKLTNNTLESVISNMGLTAEQMERYQLLLETYGNKPELFGENIYAQVNPGDYQDYDIPPEALTDQRFANMIQEAERYLGYPYVWGGSSPSTSFDCSGFVSYVINHCGNGWSMGRQTANGLLGHCTRVSASNARPGDLIFFQGTYATSGASHVGIYVGNGMMIHCGNPIQYASVNTNYWTNHFLCYGRIN